jgi:1-acyl-sn-glycerol-3-phosphate acyltransferase
MLLLQRRLGPLFATQFLGALNDNLLKSALVAFVTARAATSSSSVDTLIALSTALLVAPFFLFSALAGQLADRFEKSRLIRILKLAEIAIAVLATLGFCVASVPILLVALFLTGTHSAFFGPLKYSVLPQHLRSSELLRGNGLIEMGTFAAILLGTIGGGLLVSLEPNGAMWISIAIGGVAVLGAWSSRAIPIAPSSERSPIDFHPVRSTVHLFSVARSSPPVLLSILAASWFWFLGALVLTLLPLLALEIDGDVTPLLAIFSLGVGAGSIACERLTHGRIEPGVIPIAGALLAMFTADLALSLEARGPLVFGIPARIAIDLFLFGFAGGLFAVPIYAIMQRASDERSRSRVIAANNVANAIFMVAAAAVLLLLRALGVSIAGVLALAVVLQLGVTIATAVVTRDYLMRLVVVAIARTMYRLRARGFEHLPERGGAIVVANHVTYTDALVLGALSPRPIRFVMHYRIYSHPALNWFFRLCRVIPIAGRSEDPAMTERAFEEIDRALGRGEVVGLFPEGKLTTDGEVDAFRPGIERVLARRPVPVVPVALRGLWGSYFSRKNGGPFRGLPRRAWTRIELIVGQAIHGHDASAPLLREAVVELRGRVR